MTVDPAPKAGPPQRVGTFCLVLHTHLPWVAHHGTWPVGEEWLHQAFTGSWRRVLAMLESLAAEGYSDVLTLGVTPVVAAMLDDQYCLGEIHSWAGRWQLRAEQLGVRSDRSADLTALAAHERRAATACLADLESRWLAGGLSAVLRPLLDANIVELIGGPATHPFQPLLIERFAAAQLSVGLSDPSLRLGSRPGGIWAPECGYAPGMEQLYQAQGVSHFLVDGPAVGDRTGFGYRVGDSDVVCFARDRPVSHRIWSARDGYPAGTDYRDFHAFDHRSGFRSSRVTSLDTPAQSKLPWEPAAAAAAVRRDARRFVSDIVDRLTWLRAEHGREALVVAAFDTELFGHWWYEGPDFLEAVLRLLPQANVRVSTLSRSREAGLLDGRIELAASSWGAGQDWRVWDNEQVTDLVEESAQVQKRLLGLLDGLFGGERTSASQLRGRDPVADQLCREAFLLTSSDWAFMVSRDSAAGYARSRAAEHARRFASLADLVESGDRVAAVDLARSLQQVDGPFGHLDARTL